MSIKCFFMSLLVFLAFDLVVVEGTHFHAASVHICFDLRILNMILDDILKGKHVPRIVLLRFDMAWCPLLHVSFTVIEVWNSTNILLIK